MSDRRVTLLVAGLVVVAINGCFNVPVTPRQGLPLEPRLLGEWDCQSTETDPVERARLTMLAFDESQFYAEWKEGEKAERYRAYPATLKGVTILNVREVDRSARSQPWTVLRTTFAGDGSFSLALPAKQIMDMSDEGDALRELRSKADMASTWQSFARCTTLKE